MNDFDLDTGDLMTGSFTSTRYELAAQQDIATCLDDLIAFLGTSPAQAAER